MKLIGAYPSQLKNFHIAELAKLVQDSYVRGEYEGGKLFDTTDAAKLKESGADFQNLPLASAGDLAMADSVNHPVSLLNARYEAIGNERDHFLERMEGFLSLVNKDAVLVDQLLSMAELEFWVSRQPELSNSKKFYWTFSASHGLVSSEIPLVDPLSPTVVQSPEVTDLTKFNFMPVALSDVPVMDFVSGIGVPTSCSRFAPTGLTWFCDTTGEKEELYGDDWAKVSLLEPRPLVTFGSCVVNRILPDRVTDKQEWNNYFNITGTGSMSNMPVYVRVVFLPRRRHITVDSADTANPVLLGQKVATEDIIVYDDQRGYDEAKTDSGVGGHYVLQVFPENTRVRWLTAGEALGGETLQDKPVHISFTEYFPAYQCAINEETWSQPIMLDPERMYPDDTSDMIPMDLNGAKFPLMDELGNPLGFWMEMKALPPFEFMLKVENSRPMELTMGDFGANGTLEIEFDRPTYMNGLYLAPFVNFPVFIRSIRAEGMTSAIGDQVFSGNTLLDRAQTIRFDRRLVRRLFIKLYQENYTVKQHLVAPADKSKRDAYASMQSVLPFSVRRMDKTLPKQLSGFQYEIGLRDITGEDWTAKIGLSKKRPGIYTGGPFHIDGVPEVIRFDAEYLNTVNFYLVYRKYLEDGTVSELMERPLLPGQAMAFTAEDVDAVQAMDLFVKFVLHDEFSVVSKFMLQVSNV